MNKLMLEKLPQGLVKGWSRIIYSHKRLTRAYPPFSRFVHFIEEEAMIANDPVIAQTLMKNEAHNSKQINHNAQQNKRHSFASQSDQKGQTEASAQKQDNTATKASKRPCFNCKEDHHLDNCPKFLKLSLEDRRKYVTTNKLCFACLNPGHLADCTVKYGS